MIKRIYIDNYKCLVNFTYEPGRLELIAGKNGAGKSNVFEVVRLLQQMAVFGGKAADVFRVDSRTRWETRPIQSFEIDLEADGGVYSYRLQIVPHTDPKMTLIYAERLLFQGAPLFVYEDGQLLFSQPGQGPAQPLKLDLRQSALDLIGFNESTPIGRFRNLMFRIYCVRLYPDRMGSLSETEHVFPFFDLSNFASWYRHLSLEATGELPSLFEDLRAALEGFVSIRLLRESEKARLLVLELETPGQRPPFRLDELSDGQRALMALYTLLRFCLWPDATLLIDEPDNFVATGEIQPWLMALNDAVEERKSQALIISHHPEVMNFLASGAAVKLYRENNGPARIAPLKIDPEYGLTPAEVVARGWDDEP